MDNLLIVAETGETRTLVKKLAGRPGVICRVGEDIEYKLAITAGGLA